MEWDWLCPPWTMGCRTCYSCGCGYARPTIYTYCLYAASSSLFRYLCFSTMKCRPSEVTSPFYGYCYACLIGIECLGASCLLAAASLTKGVFKDRFRNGLTIGYCCCCCIDAWWWAGEDFLEWVFSLLLKMVGDSAPSPLHDILSAIRCESRNLGSPT